MSISEKPVALVTGGSRGIGRAIALCVGQLGWGVVVNYVRNAEAANATAESIQAAGGAVVTVQGDVASAEDRARLVATTIDEFGRLDLLVNNAAVSSPSRKDLLETDEAIWEEVLATNLKGPFFLSQRAAVAMIDFVRSGTIPSGKIINISSISAYAVSTDRAEYCIAKAGVSMMTRLFAARLAEEKVQVFELCPGIIETDMTAPVREKYDAMIATGLSPIQRWGRPEDVAAAVEAILSEKFPFSTGGRFDIDGGFHIRRL